jgi:flagellar protein FliJ
LTPCRSANGGALAFQIASWSVLLSLSIKIDMKRFRFRLQRVLDYRESLKKEKELELARRHHELSGAENRLGEIITEQNAVEGSIEERIMSVEELSLCGSYQQRLREALMQQRQLVVEAKDAVQKAQDAYVEKAVDASVLDTLKQKLKTEHARECVREERKELDKLTVMRHRFRRP